MQVDGSLRGKTIILNFLQLLLPWNYCTQIRSYMCYSTCVNSIELPRRWKTSDIPLPVFCVQIIYSSIWALNWGFQISLWWPTYFIWWNLWICELGGGHLLRMHTLHGPTYNIKIDLFHVCLAYILCHILIV